MEFTTVQKLLFFCSYILFFTVPFVLGATGYLPKSVGHSSAGTRIAEYSMATSFVDGGALDSLKLGICDGNFKYTISSSGIIESENYPAPYSRKSSCTNQFDSTADGITFEFQSFFTEKQSDFIVFRDSEGNDFGGKTCSGDLKGTRVSVDSSRLPVSIHFKSDDKKQESGFSIAISAGYDPENDLKNGPCASKT
ncbi:unnamed protein product [Oikopleura dioica]|uniref:CUB domain-containing protein n=1 Tax=Oikopleura dioica TaxID=34765 RepID=E4XL78_OIKDI|nr:unnamed protein product [Oikopleura dioica]